MAIVRHTDMQAADSADSLKSKCALVGLVANASVAYTV